MIVKKTFLCKVEPKTGYKLQNQLQKIPFIYILSNP